MTPATDSNRPVTDMAALTRSLRGSAVFVAAVTFCLSFYGLNDFARQSMKLPASLSWIVPAGLDGLTLVAIAATFLLRHQLWHVRAYAWVVFGVAAVLSMAGNHQHASDRGLNNAGTVGFTVAPVILALAAHLVVVTWRALERKDAADAQPATASDTAGSGITSPEPGPAASTDNGKVTDIRRPRGRRGKGPKRPRHDKADRARKLRDEGKTWDEIATVMNVSPRTVGRYLGTSSDTPATDTAERADADPEPATETA